MKATIQQISIKKSSSIVAALRQMDDIRRKLLIVINDDDSFFSMLSIGDVQRAIIRNIKLSSPIYKIVRTDITVAHASDDLEKVKERMKIRRNEFMPIINENNYVGEVIFWDDLFTERRTQLSEDQKIHVPVVIMAGGKGTRLAPFTNVWPKPLLPVNHKTILEDIMDKFVEVGCHKFYISVNYKAEVIKQYLKNLNHPEYKISFFQETTPLGTAGSLHLLNNKIHSTFFVSNCDIIIEEDYTSILKYHKDNNNEITIVAAIKNFPIPYGTLETGEGGQLISIQEKPDLSFKINTGMYILEPHLIRELPVNKFYHITSLIEKLRINNRKVGVFPVTEGSWTDIGNWDEYIKKNVNR